MVTTYKMRYLGTEWAVTLQERNIKKGIFLCIILPTLRYLT
jgi:hypothetical protein